MNNIQEDIIKDVICSKQGRKLLSCLLLVQPISAKELQHFGKLCILLFKGPASFEKRPFPNLSNIEIADICPVALEQQYKAFCNSSFRKILTKNLFYNAELYGKIETKRGEGILQKAIRSGLVIEKPISSKGGKRDTYYFLNSDIIFKINNKDFSLNINNHTKSAGYTHRIIIDGTHHPHKVENIAEIICLQRGLKKKDIIKRADISFFSLDQIFLNFYWMKKYQDLISDTIEKLQEANERGKAFSRYNLPPGWRSTPHLLSDAFKNRFFSERGNTLLLNPMMESLVSAEYSLSFCRSYKILRCFNNYFDHEDKVFNNSPMKLLNLLTSEDYKIDPLKRPLIFSSIIASIKHKDIYKKKNSSGLILTKKWESKQKIEIIRNSRVLNSALNLFGEDYSNLKILPDNLLKEFLGYDITLLS